MYFLNFYGLDGDGLYYLSVYDMVLLMKYVMGNEIFKKIFGIKIYKLDFWDYLWKNKYKLVMFYYEFVIGGKIGFMKKVG